MALNKELQEHVESNPHIEAVYFNEAGDWQFFKCVGYEHKVVTRHELLSEPKKVKAAKVADETEQKNN